MKKEELKACQFSNWYPNFQNQTIKSCVIPLPKEFVDYLKDDGTLVMPQGLSLGEASADKDWEEESWEDNTEGGNQPNFEELTSAISNALSDLGGTVFPKLNWSAPKDAVWINNNTLKCCTPGEIILLLKSSNFIQFDLSSISEKCEDGLETDSVDQELVLRKWANLSPGMEFRCFVSNKSLIGISQRDWRQYFDFVEAEKNSLAVEMQTFIEKKVLSRFPSDSFVVDLYKKKSGNYWIIDFNPFDEVTDSLLFSWHELQTGSMAEYSASVNITSGGEITGQFRFADRNTILQPSEYLSYRMPVDFVDLSSGSDATKLIDFMRMVSRRMPFFSNLVLQVGRLTVVEKIQGENDDSSDSEDEQWRLPR